MKKRGFYTVGLDASENMLKEGQTRFHDGVIAYMEGLFLSETIYLSALSPLLRSIT